MPSESRFQPMELEQIHADIRKLMAETMRVSAEASKPSEKSPQFFLIMVLAAFSGAGGAAVGVAVALLLKL